MFFREQFVYALVNERSNFDSEISIKKIQGLIALFDLLFSDGNMGPQHASVCDLYLYLSRLQWEYGYQDEAFESLEAALAHARSFDALTDNDKYTAPMIRHARLRMPAVKPGNLTRNLPNDWPMWLNPDCTEVAKEIKSDFRWNEWVVRTQE